MSRLAPAVSLQGHSDAAWRWLCRSLSLLVMTGTGCWWWQQWHQGPSLSIVQLSAPVACLLCVGASWSLVRHRHWQLRWDGHCWHWQGTASPAEPASRSEVHVAIDLQHWLLLRIAQEGAPSRAHWLALSKAAHRSNWHALRCALYCARPGRPSPAAPGATGSLF